jgi:hypothetical protein
MTITGTAETKFIESALNFIKSLFIGYRDLKKRVAELEAENAELRSGRQAFQKLLSEIECRPAEDHMYWKKDGTGGPYCPLCLSDDEKLIPLTHAGEETFRCGLHNQLFRTDKFRKRAARETAQGTRIPRHHDPNSWMGN